MVSAPQTCQRLIHRLIVEDDRGRRELTLTAMGYSIGRDSRCDIQLFSQFVSRRHATIIQLPNEDGSYFYRIVDGTLKGRPSSNGLLINGQKLRSHELHNADEIIFGPHAKAMYYQFDQDDAARNSPVNEFDVTIIPLESRLES